MTVEEVLGRKGRDVWSIAPEAMVLDALRLMADKGIGAVVVVSGNRPIGIFSERDYARRVVLEGRSSSTSAVGDVMTPKPVCIRPDQSVDDCMALMTEHRIRHLPVVDNDRLVGLISIGDVVKTVISDKEFVIQQLENYISGH